MDDNVDQEAAIRAYLTYLEDPSKLRDEREVQRLTSAVLAAEDPIEKLKALAELKRAAQVDGDALRAGFVASAQGWAEQTGIPASAFQELGVPDDVLAEAGFEVQARRPRTARAARAARAERRTTAATGRTRGPNVSSETLRQAIRARTEPFTLSDIVADHGASPATIRKVMEELLASGEVDNLGPTPDHRARGRAPIRYQARAGS